MASFNPDFDVAIIGGGPAGATAARYLAQAGCRCVVLEQDFFPRPHVGESLVPSSTRIFRDIDFLKVMEAEGFVKKYGAAWTSDFSNKVYDHQWNDLDPQDFVDVDFAEREQQGVGQRYTYHVDRGRFDLLLLQHAQQAGAQVTQGVDVLGVDFSDPDCARVRFQLGRKEFALTARLVIDASGRRTLLGSQMRWKVRDPVFDQLAVHTWFEGFDRGALHPGKEDYQNVHFLPLQNSWIWQIPISATVTSIGVVVQKKNFAKTGETPEAFFWKWVRSRPDLARLLEQSKQIRGFKTEGDYSYGMKQIVGDRLMLIGDAARFVDPIFSSGVSIALTSAKFASQDALSALERGDFQADSFRTYSETLRRGTRNWYEFITLYYRLNVLFTSFLANPRYRLDVLKLLQGDVYEEAEPAVLAKMRELVTQVEGDPNHPWHRLLGNLTSTEFRPPEQLEPAKRPA